MAFTVQVIFVSLCLATIGGGNADISAPSPAAISCCMSLPPTPISPCYVTTTAAPLPCPFMTTTTMSPETMTATTSTTTTEQPATSTTTEIPNSNMFGVPPYPIFGIPQRFVPIMTNPSTGQAYYLVPNPNKNGNSYSQILNVYTPDSNTGGYHLMPVAVLPQSNNNSTTVKPSSDNN